MINSEPNGGKRPTALELPTQTDEMSTLAIYSLYPTIEQGQWPRLQIRSTHTAHQHPQHSKREDANMATDPGLVGEKRYDLDNTRPEYAGYGTDPIACVIFNWPFWFVILFSRAGCSRVLDVLACRKGGRGKGGYCEGKTTSAPYPRALIRLSQL